MHRIVAYNYFSHGNNKLIRLSIQSNNKNSFLVERLEIMMSFKQRKLFKQLLLLYLIQFKSSSFQNLVPLMVACKARPVSVI